MTSSYNSITGTDSANTLIGSTGADFSASTGEDLVLGAQANDVVDLGSGNDSVSFSAMLMGNCYAERQRFTGNHRFLQHLHHVWR